MFEQWDQYKISRSFQSFRYIIKGHTSCPLTHWLDFPPRLSVYWLLLWSSTVLGTSCLFQKTFLPQRLNAFLEVQIYSRYGQTQPLIPLDASSDRNILNFVYPKKTVFFIKTEYVNFNFDFFSLKLNTYFLFINFMVKWILNFYLVFLTV